MQQEIVLEECWTFHHADSHLSHSHIKIKSAHINPWKIAQTAPLSCLICPVCDHDNCDQESQLMSWHWPGGMWQMFNKIETTGCDISFKIYLSFLPCYQLLNKGNSPVIFLISEEYITELQILSLSILISFVLFYK